MSRRALASKALLGAIATIAMAAGGCGQSGTTTRSATDSQPSAPARHGVSVTPTDGRPLTTFALRFIAPASSGRAGNSRIAFDLGLGAPPRSGCIGSRSVQVPPATKGEPVRVELDPARLGGGWCQGVYRARVIEVQRPVCEPGAMCPQYVRVVAVVGEATFRVHGSR